MSVRMFQSSGDAHDWAIRYSEAIIGVCCVLAESDPTGNFYSAYYVCSLASLRAGYVPDDWELWSIYSYVEDDLIDLGPSDPAWKGGLI